MFLDASFFDRAERVKHYYLYYLMQREQRHRVYSAGACSDALVCWRDRDTSYKRTVSRQCGFCDAALVHFGIGIF